MLKSLVLSAPVAGLLMSAASAMPGAIPATLSAAKPAPSQSDVITVAGGCGVGWHRGPYGVCVRNRAPYYYGPYVYYAPPPPPPPRRCWWVTRPYGQERICTW